MNRNARHNRHANNPRNRGRPARANFNTPQTTNAAATGPAPPVIHARTRGITLAPTGPAASSITAGMMAALIATTTLEEQCKHPTIQATALAAYTTAVEAAEEARKEYARSGQRSAVQSAAAIIAAANAAADGLRVTAQVRALNQGGQGQGQGQTQGQVQVPAPTLPVNAALPATAQPAAQAQPLAAATANTAPAQLQVQAQQLATAVNATAPAPAQPQLPAATAAVNVVPAGAQPRGTPVTFAQLANALNGANQTLAAQPAANAAQPQAQGQQPAAANTAQPGPVQAASFQPLPVRPGALPVPDPYQQLNILLHQDPNRLFNDYNFSFEGLQAATRIDPLVKRNHRPKPHSPRRRIALIHQQVLNQFPLPLGQQLQIQLHMQWKATCQSIFSAQERHQKIRGVQSKLAAALNPAAAGQWALRLNKRVQKKYVSSWLAKSYRQTMSTDTTPPTHPRPFKIRDLRAETRFADRFRGQLASKRARWNKTKLQHRLTTGALIRAHLSGPLFSAAIEYQAKHSVDTLTLTRSAIALDSTTGRRTSALQEPTATPHE
ncbi:hypothetical protein BGX24_010740 [Mortierella sp. AD032]|nr:hypothetical protein BGX24_010740 [Mortierella sp. AD032]